MATTKPFAFILMPFDDKFNDVYRIGIQETAKKVGVVAERVDEQIYTESILERIYRQIDSADFIIADMTGKNPNVFYEVGYAHAQGKVCTLITQDSDDIPFDLKHHRHLIYDGSISKLKELLEIEMAWILEEIEKRKTSAFDIKLTTKSGFLEVNDWSRSGSFEMVIDVHNRTTKRSPEIDAVYIYTSDKWTFSQEKTDCGYTESDIKEVNRRHILETKTNRLAPGMWMQLRCEGTRTFWLKHRNEEEPRDTYQAKGYLIIEIATAEGSFKHQADLDVEFDEIPF